MTEVLLSGETRIYVIVGDPIAQVKSPEKVTAALRANGLNALLVPYHVVAENFDSVLNSLKLVQNCDGLVVTVPHKFAAARHCTYLTDGAAFLGAVNVMRRDSAGGWEGHMCDGDGFVNAIAARGGQVRGKAAVLLGAGGAGSAVGYSLLEAGVSKLAVFDTTPTRSEELIVKLARRFGERVCAWSGDLAGFGVIANCTPVGLGGPEETPISLHKLRPDLIVSDVVTAASDTALIRAARLAGCVTSTGHDMYASLLDMMVRFLLRKY